MQLQRSDKARLELSSRVRALNVRERGALFLADGTKTLDEMRQLLQDDSGMLARLMAQGYLIAQSPLVSATPQPMSSPANVRELARFGLQVDPPEAILGEPFKPPAAPGNAADPFDGKRSLATTRMFLFDICERMFARKAPELALHFRDALREARERESMLEIAREIVAKVEQVAGAERADGLSERIARLLPAETLPA